MAASVHKTRPPQRVNMKIALFVSVILVSCAIAANGDQDVSTFSPVQENVPLTVISEDESEPIDFICECGIVDTKDPTKSDKILLKQKMINISCDSVGGDQCIQLCTALAEGAKNHGPQLICNVLENYQNLKVSIYGRICGLNNWTYTGLTASNEICCRERKVIDCKTSTENSFFDHINNI